ncbi:homing endonuclease associated repeat-containing protein [Aminipila sp.]|uniref:homing endonuclease associated repeat-containing protein n=1 Tax=Aminipila sp. TaxID=2060095 RepID=UPI00289B0C70|nr:hypothetical protein [Aminipila sp.]
MHQGNVAEKYLKEFDEIVEEGIRTGNLEYDEGVQNASQIFQFSKVESGKGKIVYSSFSDEDLCKLLQNKAKQLGYVPAQKEIYWLYRIYIKKRFGNWPKALMAAGLSKKAGKCGDSYEKIKQDKLLEKEMLTSVKNKAEELGRPPHMHEMKEVADYFKHKFDTWAELLEAAGVNNQWKDWKPVYKVTTLSEEDKRLLEMIHKKSIELGRPPMRMEIPAEIRTKLKRNCGTWRNILYQMGLEPVQKIKPFNATYLDGRRNRLIKHSELLEGSVFKLVNPDKKTIAQLETLKKEAVRLNRPLVKSEIPKEIYNHLIEQCISYRNLLYQIDLQPLDKTKEKEIEKELRKRRK